ncbi:hypothetical protein ES704_02061 [subsurface metagenome]|jgi:hypothetical protein
MDEQTLSMVTDETEFEPVASNPDESIPVDIRGDYDEIAYVKDGILYRKGSIVQVWWDKWGKETWTNPSEEQARENFNAMKERWASSELGNLETVEPVDSKMRQGMRTWLKAECEDVGVNMLRALSGINYAYDAAYGLNVPGRAYSSEKYIEASLEEITGYIATLPINLLTAEERREVFTLKDEILEALKGKIPVRNVELKLLDLADLTKKYLLEKVVECQIGKTGS